MSRPRVLWVATALLFTALWPVARAETLEQVFDRGNTAYENGRYDEAREAYHSQVASASLYQ